MNFNPLMDRRQLNLAGRVLDPLGPFCNLWALAITADDEQCEIHPAVVIDMVKRAISLVGNAPFCATSDRRKGLLAKLAPECLDLLDDKALFTRGHAHLLGKKFKKNLLKDLKLSKEIDNLMPRKRASSFTQMTRRFNQTSLFGRSPGKARTFEATQTTHSSAGRTNHESFLSNRNKTQTTNRKTTRYATKFKCNFSSFAYKFSNPTVRCECSTRRQAAIFSQKLEHDNKRSIHFGNSTRLQTRPCRNTFSSFYAQTSAFFQKRNRASRQRNSRFARQKRHSSGSTHPRTVYQYRVCRAKKRRRNKACNKSKGSEPVSELPPFQNGGHSLVRDLLQPNDWMGKIDLKDAYFVIPIWENHQKFLRFLWKDSLMEFACLSFGLASAPRIFTKLMKPVFALLRRSVIRLIIYLDDILFMNQTPTGLQRDMSTAIHLLEKPRFCNKLNKISTEANQTLEFLGFIVDTKNMTLVLPQGKVTAIKDLCSQMLSQTELTVRDITRLTGKLTASIQAIFPAPLHYRQLQGLKNTALQSGGNYNTKVSLNPACQEELQWWIAHLNAWNGRAILTPPPDLVIETDASQQGWGAVCKEVRTGGLWSQNERLLHIDCLELLAGAFAVKCFTKNQICLHVRFRMDNTTAIAYLNKLGGTRSLVLSNLVAEL